MQALFGHEVKTKKPVLLDTLRSINGHVQVTGITGMGKTTQLRALITSMVKSASELGQPLRVHVFDPHEDIELPWCSEVKFSEATPYGYNPLEINPNRDHGGVRRAIEKFISAVKKHKAIGTKQESVMRYLLEDLYASRGFKADDPNSWIPDDPRMIREMMIGREGRVYLDVAYEHRGRFKTLLKDADSGKFRGGFDDDPAIKCWWVYEEYYDGDMLMWEPRSIFKTAPTIDDAVKFTERKLKAQFCGTNSAAMALLKDVNQAARGYHRKVAELSKRGAALSEVENEMLQRDLDNAKQKAVDAYTSYLDAIRTGRELDDLIRYSSTEVLTSVYERFQNLRAIGINNPVAPPFDPAMPIWRYRIMSLEIPVQRMFVDMVCRRIFERAIQRGHQKDVIEIIIADEAARYATDEEDNVLNAIANEARKFGLALWAASQTPGHFSDDFIKATGTIIILGLAAGDTNLAARKLGIDPAMLTQIKPQDTALIQIKNKGELQADFQVVKLI